MNLEEALQKVLDLETKNSDLASQLTQKDELIQGLTNKQAEHNAKIDKFQDQIRVLREQNTDLFLKVANPNPIINNEGGPQDPPEEKIPTLNDILY